MAIKFLNTINTSTNATFAGQVTATEYNLPSGGMLDWANGDARIVEGLVNNYSLSFQTWDGTNLNTALRLDGNNNATFAGKLNIGSPSVSNGVLNTAGQVYIEHQGVNWNETSPGTTRGSIHMDPVGSGGDNTGNAITFGASDHSGGTVGDAGIYVRSDGSYGTKMYIATTDSYATGSKTSITIDANGDVLINRGHLTLGSTPAASTSGNAFLVSNSGQVQFRTNAQVLSDIGGAPATGAFLPLTGGTLTGNLSVEADNYLLMGEGGKLYVNYPLNAAPDNIQTWYIILCANTGGNDINGNIAMDRTSGLRFACSIDVLVSAGSSAVPVGGMKAMATAGTGHPSFKLVSCIYDGASHIAVEIYNPDGYSETSGVYFNGRAVSTNTLLTNVPASAVSSVVDFEGNTVHDFEGDTNISRGDLIVYDSVGVGVAAPQQKLHVQGGAARIENAATGLGGFISVGNNTETAGNYSAYFFGNTALDQTYFKGGIAYETLASTNGRGDMHFLQDSGANDTNATIADSVMTILNGGKVGINTVAPTGLLNVEGNATGDNTPQITISSGGVDNNAILQFDDDEGGQICAVGALEGNILTCASTGDFLIKTNSGSITGTTNTRLYINQSGNVGIGTGTATPGGRLHVKGGDIQTTDTTGTNGILRIRSTLNTTPTFGYPNVGAGDAVIEGGGTTQRQPGVITLINDDSSIAANQDLGVIQFVGKDDNANGYTSSQIIGTSSGEPVTGNSGGGILRFLTSNGGTGVGVTEKMRIDKFGKVGIGVVPTATLDVSGSFKLQGGGSTYLSIASYYGSPFINTGTSGGTVQFGAPASNITNIQVQGTITAVRAVRMGNESAAASASNAGSTRYRVSGNNSYMDMSMRTGATSYAWVNIVQNNW